MRNKQKDRKWQSESSKILMANTLQLEDLSLLNDPVNPNGEFIATYIGRGSFAIVKLQLYQGYKVAVKKVSYITVTED